MSDAPLVILDILGRGLRARVRWNDVVVMDDDLRVQAARSVKLNGWSVAGRNRLVVELAARPEGSGGSETDGEAPSPAFEVRLRRTYRNAPDEADRTELDFEWYPGQVLTPGFTSVVDHSVALASPTTWSWERGYRFASLGMLDLLDIIQHLEGLSEALRQRDIDAVVRLQSTQVAEQAVALGLEPNAMISRYADFLSTLMLGQGWDARFAPPQLEELHLMAGGRVVRAATNDGPPIQASSLVGSLAIDPYLSRIDGRWIIVR